MADLGERLGCILPGPFEAVLSEDRRQCIIRDDHGDVASFGPVNGMSPENILANSQLYAMGPAVLSALITLRQWCIPGMNWTDAIAQTILAQTDDVIAEALGDPDDWKESPL